MTAGALQLRIRGPVTQCICRTTTAGIPLLEVHIPADRSSIAYRRGLRERGYSDFFLR